MKKISIDGLTNVLSPKEMKQVTGGVDSGTFFWCYYNNVEITSGLTPSSEWVCLTEMCNFVTDVLHYETSYGNVVRCVCENTHLVEGDC